MLTPQTQQLLSKLHITRQLIRQEEMQTYGKAPQIVSDEALLAMAQLEPTTPEDFSSIPSIGQATVARYGERFITTINDHQLRYAKLHNLPVDDTVHNVLKSLERKLVGINRRNRLLYLPVLRDKVAFDLMQVADAETVSKFLLSGKGVKIRIPNISTKTEQGAAADAGGEELAAPLKEDGANKGKFAPKKKSRSGVNYYSKFSILLREINRLFRENGSYDLYIGYPYAEGRLAGEDFDIKAPLALFPLTAEKTAKEIVLSLDRSRSVLYNTNLMLACAKTNGTLPDIEHDAVEEINALTFEQDVTAVFLKYGLEIKKDKRSGGFKPFEASTAESFEKYKQGELYLRGYCLAGRFALADSALQKDFAKIIARDTVPPAIVELVDASGEDDLQQLIEAAPDRELNDEIKVRERDLVYINSLNDSQEKVLSALQTSDKIVVAGPPGTGKSQVITSVIADFAMRGKSVLMISEKKAALDVICSRMGTLSDFSLLVDDVENKNEFYSQIVRMLDINLAAFNKPEQTDDENLKIELDLARLDKVASALYAKTELGVEYYKLFRECIPFDVEDKADKLIYTGIRDTVLPALMAANYPETVALKDFFNDSDVNNTIRDWEPVYTKTPIVSIVRYDLVPIDVAEFNALLDKAAVQAALIKITPWYKRGKLKKALKKDLVSILPRYISVKPDAKTVKAVVANIPALQTVLGKYSHYVRSRKLLDNLSQTQVSYSELLLTLSRRWDCEMADVNMQVYRYYVATKIERWEVEHRDVLETIDKYRDVLSDIASRSRSKQDFIKQTLYFALAQNFQLISLSKKFGDMRRMAESGRKTSVVKFIQRFDNELFLGIKIWLLTPDVASTILPLKDGMFDLVVFDEASQMYVERAIPGLIRAKKILIAGDTKQLRPSSLGTGRIEIDEETLEQEGIENTALEVESLLDLAESKYNQVMLDCHYRSRYEELIAFSNYAFYKGKLMVSPNTARVEKPIEILRVPDGTWIDRTNIEEARAVVGLIKKLLAERKNRESIGVITFNSTQRDKIDDLLDEECGKDSALSEAVLGEQTRIEKGEDVGLFIKNIENVQGDERDIIIFSVGYAPNMKGKIARQFGWLNCAHGENRLNVAITRAKSKVYIVTSIVPSQLDVEDLDSIGPKMLRSYMEYAFAVDEGNESNAKQILASLSSSTKNRNEKPSEEGLIAELAAQLRLAGLGVDTNIGIGGYNIDLAVKDSQNNYCLGIELDERVYGGKENARERDYHRQSYLEGRGWKIYRLYSTSYFHSPDTEIAKIIAAASE